jgi:hypothetical protein
LHMARSRALASVLVRARRMACGVDVCPGRGPASQGRRSSPFRPWTGGPSLLPATTGPSGHHLGVPQVLHQAGERPTLPLACLLQQVGLSHHPTMSATSPRILTTNRYKDNQQGVSRLLGQTRTKDDQDPTSGHQQGGGCSGPEPPTPIIPAGYCRARCSNLGQVGGSTSTSDMAIYARW